MNIFIQKETAYQDYEDYIEREYVGSVEYFPEQEVVESVFMSFRQLPSKEASFHALGRLADKMDRTLMQYHIFLRDDISNEDSIVVHAKETFNIYDKSFSYSYYISIEA